MGITSKRLRQIIMIALTIVLITSASYAAIYPYEMDMAPDDPGLANPMTLMTDRLSGFGIEVGEFPDHPGDTPPVGDAGLVVNDDGESGGAGVFIDSAGYGTGYYLTGLGDTFTVDMRVRGRKQVLPTGMYGSRSIGIASAVGHAGRGIRIEPTGLTFVAGVGPSTAYVYPGNPFVYVDLSDFHMVRIVVGQENIDEDPELEVVGRVYDLQTPGGPPWTELTTDALLFGDSGFAEEIKDGTGGIHLNTFAGGSTTQSDFVLDWIRIATGVDQPDPATGEIISGATEPCISGVLPQATKKSYANVGQTADPSEIEYEVFNTGSGGINYTVKEVDDQGQDHDYTWLSLNKGSDPIPLSAMSSDTVIASLDTAGLAPNVYTAYIKFADDCAEPNVFTRVIVLTIANWEVAPPLGIYVADCPQTGSQYAFTVTNTNEPGGDNISYTVAEVDDSRNPLDHPWMALDKSGGGPLAPGQSDTVTVTLTQQTGTDTVGYLLFTHVELASEELRFVEVNSFTPQIVKYQGEVDPDTADSAGPGITFVPEDAAGGPGWTWAKQGVVVDDPDAVDGKAWYINDASDLVTVFRTSPDAHIHDELGATLVVRLKVISNHNTGSMLFINDHGATDGASAKIGYGGPGPSINGKVNEYHRSVASADLGGDKTAYRVVRLTIGFGTFGTRTINIYMDEGPNPVLTITNAEPKPIGWPDSFGLGCQGRSGWGEYYFDWITATDAGMYAPGEEIACLGESLNISGGACCLPDTSCTITLSEEACQALNGTFKGSGTKCEEVNCCPVPFADVDRDSDVDQDDFAVFQLCYTGLGVELPDGHPPVCDCLDQGDDNHDNEPDLDKDIDESDFNAFQGCASGPGIPADPGC